MKIAACIKRVPATETVPKIAADGKGLDPANVEFMLSFYDELAVEEAIRAKEKHGGEVIVVTLGPPEASKELRECLAKGADRAVLIADPHWMRRDCRATAKILSAALAGLGVELVFTGRVATDRDNAAVGPMVATYLGWSCVTDVIGFELDGARVSARRESERGIEHYTCPLPAVVTCQKGLNEPRYAGLKGIMAAKKKTIEETAAVEIASESEVIGLALPPARKEGRILGRGPEAIPALIDALRNEAQVL